MKNPQDPLLVFSKLEGQIAALGNVWLLVIIRLTEDAPESRREFIDDLNHLLATFPHDINPPEARVAVLNGYMQTIKNLTNHLTKTLDEMQQ